MASFVAASAAVGGSGSLSPSLPAGTTTGDVVFIFCGSRDGGNTLTTPTDWELMEGTGPQYVFARIRDSAWTMPTLTYSGNVAQRVAQAVTIRGLNTTSTVSAILVAESEVLNSTSFDMPIPALTIPSGNDLFVMTFCTKSATATADGFSTSDLTAPSPWTVGSAGKGANGNSVICASFYTQQTGAASNISADTALIAASRDESLIRRVAIFAFETAAASANTAPLIMAHRRQQGIS